VLENANVEKVNTRTRCNIEIEESGRRPLTDEELPEGRKVIGNRWVFEFKLDIDGGPPIHKARLVAQGFSQIPFVDYNATFTPFAKSTSVRFVAIHTALHGWHLECFDVT
jgi:hypothetical protein